MDRKILTYDSVEISFAKAVVHDVSFSLNMERYFTLVGESGSGKSTLDQKAAMGLLGPDGLVTRGDIRYMDQNILIYRRKKKKDQRCRNWHIFQDAGASLCPIRTIGEQIYESMCAHTKITKKCAQNQGNGSV